MGKDFNQLNTDYQKAIESKDQLQQEDLIKKMKRCLIEQNEGKDELTTHSGKYNIPSASYQQLLEINGVLNEMESQKVLTKISDDEREKQMSRNNYSPDNPYPGK